MAFYYLFGYRLLPWWPYSISPLARSPLARAQEDDWRVKPGGRVSLKKAPRLR